MEKFERLINEPYLEKEYIKEMFLNDAFSPIDVNLYTEFVISNSIVSISCVHLKSNIRLLEKNKIKSDLSKDESAELISSLSSILADGYLFALYIENWDKSDDVVDRQQFLHLLKQPLSRTEFESKTLREKQDLINLDLSQYISTKNIKFLIESLLIHKKSQNEN